MLIKSNKEVGIRRLTCKSQHAGKNEGFSNIYGSVIEAYRRK